ncbi:MAG: hypothetical protein ABSB78_12540 [Bacteroidota bacterium]
MLDWKKIWKDPVWSKVIAGIILVLIPQVPIFISGLIGNTNIYEVYKDTYKLLKSSHLIKGWIIFVWAYITIIISILLIIKYSLVKKTLAWIKIKKYSDDDQEEKEFTISDPSTVFFHYRFCDAFPGFDSGYREFAKRKDIINRLKILLAQPLNYHKAVGHSVMTDPIWWFRGFSAAQIYKFEVLNRNKILLNIDELIIEKLVAFRGNDYYQDFVYIQCSPDEPTGLYAYDKKEIESRFNDNREYSEEYAIYKKKFISRLEYDDGSALINGKPVRTEGAILRSRTLTKYNFVISAKLSPYNCDEFCDESREYLGKLLKDEIVFDDFISWMKKFPRNRYEYY